jgi:hypothetical protein
MSTTLADLLFWIVALIALFVVLRWVQRRKDRKPGDQERD